MDSITVKSIIIKIVLFVVLFTLIKCKSEPEMVHVRYINKSTSDIDTFVVDNTIYYTTLSAFIVDFNRGDTSEYFSFEESGYIPFNLTASSGLEKFYSNFVYGKPASDSTRIYGVGFYDVIIKELDTKSSTIFYNIEQK